MVNLKSDLFKLDKNEMKVIVGGKKMSYGYEGGVRNEYDTASKTSATSSSKAQWDNVTWYDLCGNEKTLSR